MSNRPVYLMAALTVGDVAVTLPYWQHEANPIVIQLGRAGFVAVNILAATAAILIWKTFRLDRSLIATTVVSIYNMVMLLVLLSNLGMVLIL